MVENVLDRRGPVTFATYLPWINSCEEDSSKVIVLFGWNVTFLVGLEVLESVRAQSFLEDDNSNFPNKGRDSSRGTKFTSHGGGGGLVVLLECLAESGVGATVFFFGFS